MTTIILTDSIENLGAFGSLENAYQHCLTIIHNLKKYNNNLDLADLCKKFKLTEYNNNLINEIYIIHNGKLISSNKSIKEFSNIGINILSDKVFSNINNINEESSEMKLFIPVTDLKTVNEVITNKEITKSICKPNIDEIKVLIEKLEKEKSLELERLDNLKNNYEEQEEKYIENFMKIEQSKLSILRKKDKMELISKKFDADKKLYYILKEEIDNEKRNISDIPILFKEIYPIFQYIENNNITNIQQAQDIYEKLIKQIDFTNIQDYKELFDQDFDEVSFYCNNDKNP